MGWRDTFETLGALLVVGLLWLPWGWLIDWAKEEIKSKPNQEVT